MIERLRRIGLLATQNAENNRHSVAYLVAELAEALEQTVPAESRKRRRYRKNGSQSGVFRGNSPKKLCGNGAL
jgi:hypothetical protein